MANTVGETFDPSEPPATGKYYCSGANVIRAIDDAVAAAATDASKVFTVATGAMSVRSWSAASNPVGGDGTVNQVVKKTQAAYDSLTPVSTTLYVIDG